MAQTTTVNAILSQLVTSIIGQSTPDNHREHKHSRDTAAKAIKAQQYVRTNQFEVDAAIEGLLEKFFVLDHEDLSVALKARLDELSKASRSKWNPEILSLFLHLSDRPAEKSNLEALKLIKPPTPPPSLTWEEILADDPLTGDIWADETYSTGSSEDEFEAPDVAPSTASKGKSVLKTVDEDDSLAPETLLVEAPKDALQHVEGAQFWTKDFDESHSNQPISELQAIRDIIFMIRGLPASLFTVNKADSVVFYNAGIAFFEVSNTSLNDMLQSLAGIGSDLLRLRLWTRKPQSTALLQAFNASITSKIRTFDGQLAAIEARFVDPSIAPVVSLLRLHETIRSLARPLLYVGELVSRVPAQVSGFACLEFLYDDICTYQATGDTEIYELLALIFFDCLKVYLKPVRRWMEAGDVVEGDDTFFISITDKGSAASSLWHDRFGLRTTPDGELFAPKFLRPAGKRILNAGKSIVFLRQLGKADFSASNLDGPSLDFVSICQMQSSSLLAPFSELFEFGFDDWISSKYGPASSILRQELFINCGLWKFVDALEHIYFSKDGSRFQAFADEIFQRMDGRKKAWNDRFLLSELARSTFGSIGAIDADRISIRTVQVKCSERSIKSLASVVIELNLPWPILNILQRNSFPTYQRVFRLLLQIYRVKYVLRLDSLESRRTTVLMKNQRLGHLVRHQLILFIDIIQSYMTETVIQTLTEILRGQLDAAEDIDAMATVHEHFIIRLQACCLLSKNLAPIYDSIVSLLDLAVAYTDNQARHVSKQTAKSQPRSTKTIRHYRKPRRRMDRGRRQSFDDSSSEDEDGDDDYDADSETSSTNNESYEERLQKIQDHMNQLLGFAVAGLRGVSRAGGEPMWEMLADRLEWGSGRTSG